MQLDDSCRNLSRRSLTSVEFVLFDAVGTLIFPDPSPAQVYQAVGQQFGFCLPLNEVQQRFSAAFHRHHVSGATEEGEERRRWKQVIADVFDSPPDSQLFDALWDHFSRAQSWSVYDEVAEVLADLARRKVPIGIASNFDARLVTLCSELSPLRLVPRIFYSSAVGWSKPRPEFFAHVQRQLGLEPARILLVGDDEEKDFAGALNAGWQAILIDRTGMRREENAIASLRELIPFLP